MTEIILPRIDEEIEESSIIFWHIQEGDTVKKGDVLVEVQTEKAVSEIESEIDGILKEITVKRGDVAKVGDILGIITKESGLETQKVDIESDKSNINEDTQKKKETFVRAPPRLRKLAKDLGVDLTEVQESVAGRKITETDIRSFLNEEDEAQGEKLTGIRQTIAKRMKSSIQNTAQLTETAYADVTELAMKRKEVKDPLSWNTWILYATVQALKKHIYMNGTYKEEKLNQSDAIHLGVAIDSEEGLIVPVVENAEECSLMKLNQEIDTIVKSVNDKKIKPDKLSGSTFTVTNLGGFGIHFFTPIINPSEIAILGLGTIENYLVLEEGKVRERMRLPLSLTFDHQIIDGAPAARFLQTLVKTLEHPDKMS